MAIYGSKRILGNYAAVLEITPRPAWPPRYDDVDFERTMRGVIEPSIIERVHRFYNYTGVPQKKGYIVIKEKPELIAKARLLAGTRTIPGFEPTEVTITKYTMSNKDRALLFDGKIQEEQILIDEY